MCANAAISNYLGLVPHGTHGIEMQHQGKKIAIFANHKSTKHNWREAVMFATLAPHCVPFGTASGQVWCSAGVGWHQTLFYSVSEAQAFATEHGAVVYTWQCFGKQNWLRRGATNIDAFCYTVLPTHAPESVRLADDDGDASRVPQDDLNNRGNQWAT